MRSIISLFRHDVSEILIIDPVPLYAGLVDVRTVQHAMYLKLCLQYVFSCTR